MLFACFQDGPLTLVIFAPLSPCKQTSTYEGYFPLFFTFIYLLIYLFGKGGEEGYMRVVFFPLFLTVID